MIDIFKDCSSLTELDISNFDIRQIKEDYFSFEEYTGLSNLLNVKVKQSAKLWPSTIRNWRNWEKVTISWKRPKWISVHLKDMGFPCLSVKLSGFKAAASGEKRAASAVSLL